MNDFPSGPQPAAVTAESPGLWRQPQFRRLWIGQTISEFGSWMGATSLLAILVLDATPAQMGMLETARSLPVLLVGLFAGVWADRWRRKPVLISTDLARGLILAAVAVAALAGVLQMAALYAAAFVIGSMTVLFDAAYRAYVPHLVSRRRLVEANSKLSATASLAEIASPGLGGVLVQVITAPATMLLDAISFLASALFIGSIQAEEPRPKPAETPVSQDLLTGLRQIAGQPLLRGLAAGSATRSFFGGFFAALYSLFVLKTVGLSPAVLGILIGAGGVGALLGTLAVGRMTKWIGMGRTLLLTLPLSGLLSLLVPFVGYGKVMSNTILLVSQLVGDFFLAIYFITELSLRQLVTPDHMLGRLNSSFDFLVGGAGTLGILSGGFIGQVHGLRPALFIAAGGMILACTWLYFSPVRSFHEQPA